MDLIVNSLYSNREIFLRELVSNASDALDKQRLNALQGLSGSGSGSAPSGPSGEGPPLRVRLRGDAEAGTLTIEDTGVGMTREELVGSLGTIARSGTKRFAEALRAKNEAGADGSNLIGQFGVGFYSSFLVADRVTVTSQSASVDGDGGAWTWESAQGSHEYTVRPADAGEAPEGGRGTRIVLHLKEDASEFASPQRIKALVARYSDFVTFPVEVLDKRSVPRRVVDAEATEAARAAARKAALAAPAEEGEDEAARAKKADDAAAAVQEVEKTEYDEVEDYGQANAAKPLWVRPPGEVDQAEYDAFFMSTFKEFAPPLGQAHFSVEGTVEFTGLLFVPGMAPFDQFSGLAGDESASLRLYARRVFISDTFDKELLPRWLGFLRGVIDSSDIPLNVSREILQESRATRAIKKQVARRAIALLQSIADDEDASKFAALWESFGRNLKLGVVEDDDSRKKIAPLLRFASTHTGSDADKASKEASSDEKGDEKKEDKTTETDPDAPVVSLTAYVSRMREDQPGIFFMAGESAAAGRRAPFVERLVRLGYEVLLFTEPIDEYVTSSLGEFEGKPFVDVTKEDLELPEDKDDSSKEALKEKEARLKPLTDFVADRLSDRGVSAVRLSTRLDDTPCVLVTSKQGWSANMERIMRAQAMGDGRAAEYMRGRRILELNPDAAVVARLAGLLGVGAEGETKEPTDEDKTACGELVDVMHETALFTSGFSLDDTAGYARRVFAMMERAAGGGK